MFVENLLSKINSALQLLAKALDLIHKFPTKQREHYFQTIKHFQSQLQTLKSTLKQSNALHTQKLFNAIYLNINALNNQIQDCSLLLANKQNRDSNRPNPIRQSKKTHQQAFRLIAEREDEINRLKLQLFEKEELIKINYEQLMDYKRQCSLKDQHLKQMKTDTNRLQRELSLLNEDLMQKEEQIIDMKLNDQERQRLFRHNLQDLQVSRKDLQIANQRIQYFQHLTEISINKTRLVQENMRNLQIEAQNLNENYRLKQHQNIKKQRIVEQLQMKINSQIVELDAEKAQNTQMREDIHRFQQELGKLQDFVYNLRVESTKERQAFNNERQELVTKIETLKREKETATAQLKQSQDKFMSIYNQCSELQEKHQDLKLHFDKKQEQVQQLSEKFKSNQNKLKLAQKQSLFVSKQKQILNEQLSKSLANNKQFEAEINKLREQLKSKEAQKNKLASSAQASNSKLKALQRDKAINQRRISTLTEEVNDCKVKMLKFQQEKKYKDKQTASLNARLLKAKIEAVHQIRAHFSHT